MAPTSYKAFKFVRKALAVIVATFVVFTIFVLPTGVPSGMRALQIIRNFDGKLRSGEAGNHRSIHSANTEVMHRAMLRDPTKRDEENETSRQKRSEDNGMDRKNGNDAKVLSLVDRILEMEELIAHFVSNRGGGLDDDAQQFSKLELLAIQLKLVKTLLEKSVIMMKLADLASHARHTSLLSGMDTTSWIAWDYLEPATSELEREVQTLIFGGDNKQERTYGSRQAVAAAALMLSVLVGSLILCAVKLTRSTKIRSAESMV